MDNILDIIIFLIILYGFLSPFFSKKKNQPLPPDEFNNKSEGEAPKPRSYNKYGQKDVLQEIEELFNKAKGEQPAIESLPTYSEHKKSEGSDYRPERVKSERYSASGAPQNEGPARRTVKPVEQKPILAPAHLTQEYLVNTTAIRVREMIKKGDTLKEAFVLSEILKRPSFRRR